MFGNRRTFPHDCLDAIVRSAMRISQALLLGLAVAIASPGITHGAPLDEGKLKVLHRFTSQEGQPYGSLIYASDKKFYGFLRDETLVYSFYRMLPGGQVTVLRRFEEPDSPEAITGFVEASDGQIYVTSAYGGQTGHGTFFRISRSGDQMKVLHTFTEDGCYYPGALIQASDGDFYATASGGRYYRGCVIRMTKGGEVSVLHEFGDPNRDDDDGNLLWGKLVEASDGLLYGVANEGGRHRGGTVYRMNRQGFFQVVHHFHKDPDSPDGRHPNSSLAAGPDGALYGTTSGGNGTIYKIDLERNLTTLHEFNVNDGLRPSGTLSVGADGIVTGNTSWGGGGNEGVVYQLHPDGSYHKLHTYAADGSEGGGYNSLRAVENEFYGTSITGDGGIAFRIRKLIDEAPTPK